MTSENADRGDDGSAVDQSPGVPASASRDRSSAAPSAGQSQSTTDEREVTEALERLGLSSYEAKVFVALQKIGTGTARDVYRIADVPRSQVYGAAERLADAGLIEIQHSSPLQYRPVALDEARAILDERFERERTLAFDYLESVRTGQDGGEERQEVWSLSGRSNVTERLVDLATGAESSLFFAVRDETLVDERLRSILVEQARAGVPVTIVSEDPDVHTQFEDVPVNTYYPPAGLSNERACRVLVVDGDAVLLSVLGKMGIDASENEAAIWSADSGFATVLSDVLTGWVETSVQTDDRGE